MSENRGEIFIGSAVLAAAIAFFVYMAQSTGLGGDGSTYSLSASFRSAQGISVGTDVRLAGVKIGSVTELALNKQTFRADAEISVKQDIEIPDDSAIIIASEGLLGGNYVELVPGGSPFNFEPGGEIEDTQGAVSLISLLLKFVSGGDE